MSLRLAASAALLSLAAFSTSASACTYGECYDKVRTPDVYRTVDRPVVVRRGYREVVETEPVVVVRPERVMVQPSRVEYVRTPPVTRTVFQEIVVRRGGYRWKTTYGPYGERRCKVRVPAEVKVVPREVVVAPGRRVRVRTPAVYAYQNRAIAVRPAKRFVRDVPPVVEYESSRVLVRRGTTAWVRAGSYE